MLFFGKTIVTGKATFGSFAALLVLALVGMTLTGCGGGDDETTSTDIKGSDGAAGKNSSASGSSASSTPKLDPLHPVVLLETSLGTIKVQLDTAKAPGTVQNFLSYVARREFDQTIFHQVFNAKGQDEPKVVIGGGYDPKGEERHSSGAIRNEADNGLKNLPYTIAMAREAELDSATRHFFFNLANNEMLDHSADDPESFGYCVFGEVIEGTEIVDKISRVEVQDTEQFDRTPVKTVLLKTARRIK